MIEKEAHEDVVDVFTMSRKGMTDEITGYLLRDGKIGFYPGDLGRLMEEQAKARRYSRLGLANLNARGRSPQQVADDLGLGRDTVDRMIEDKTLYAVDCSAPGARKRLWVIPIEEVNRLLRGRGKK